MLWLWALGLCDQFVRGQLAITEYDQKAEEIYNEVKRLNRNAHSQTHLQIRSGKPGDQMLQLDSAREQIGSLSVRTSFNLFLVDNWTLYDSLQYSESVIPKIRVWQRGSYKKLKEIVARMGIPLAQSKQKFEHLDQASRGNLINTVARLIVDKVFNPEIFTTDVCRQFDHRHQFSSLDISRMANALLACPSDFTGILFWYFDSCKMRLFERAENSSDF